MFLFSSTREACRDARRSSILLLFFFFLFSSAAAPYNLQTYVTPAHRNNTAAVNYPNNCRALAQTTCRRNNNAATGSSLPGRGVIISELGRRHGGSLGSATVIPKEEEKEREQEREREMEETEKRLKIVVGEAGTLVTAGDRTGSAREGEKKREKENSYSYVNLEKRAKPRTSVRGTNRNTAIIQRKSPIRPSTRANFLYRITFFPRKVGGKQRGGTIGPTFWYLSRRCTF